MCTLCRANDSDVLRYSSSGEWVVMKGKGQKQSNRNSRDRMRRREREQSIDDGTSDTNGLLAGAKHVAIGCFGPFPSSPIRVRSVSQCQRASREHGIKILIDMASAGVFSAKSNSCPVDPKVIGADYNLEQSPSARQDKASSINGNSGAGKYTVPNGIMITSCHGL